MRGDETREHIIRTAAAVFNRRGYAGASVSDLEEATGLKTGGIYRHFPGGKEALALEAFDFAVAGRSERLRAAVAEGGTAVDRLHRLIATLTTSYADRIPGGCPVMNAAIEHDDAGSAALRARARRTMERWHSVFEQVIAEGRARGELKPDVDPADAATVFLATWEGAVMLSGLTRDRSALHVAAAHLTRYVDDQLQA
jgi:TetR/AcrR family transcriptional repressor of nem operon